MVTKAKAYNKLNPKPDVSSFQEHLDKQYGKIGTKKRMDFEIKAKAFAIGAILKEERRLAGLTQDQLADKTGTKKVLYHALKMGIVIYSCQHFISCSNMALAVKSL